MSLDAIQQHLHRLCPAASFDPPEYLTTWFTPTVSTLFLQHAVMLPTMTAHRLEDRPMRQCYQTAIGYAVERPELYVWFGFILTDEAESGGFRWWLHARCTDQGLTTRYEADPCASIGQTMVALPWGFELCAAISGLTIQEAERHEDQLPPALRRYIGEFPRGSREWAEQTLANAAM
jgi:hypothetical protein